jgi:MobA/MobL family
VAICFIRANIISRSGGKSATAAAAYRSGEKIVDRATDKTHDYTKKTGIDHSEILTPITVTEQNEWMVNRAELWNRVEAAEKRSDAQLAREMIIAIPRELDREDRINLVREHVQSSYIDRGMIADINLHHLDGTNPHAHVMLTMRQLKIDERGIVSFGNKDRGWNDKKLLQTQMKEWEILTNQYLERAGIETRIDARSYEEQEIARIPQVHVGSAAWKLEQQGIRTTPGDRNREVAAANQAIENSQTEIVTAQGKIEIELRLEIERRAEAERAAAEKTKTAANQAAFQSILDLVATKLEVRQRTPLVNDGEKYFPTRREIYGWISNPDCAHPAEINALGRQLKLEYMAQDFMRGQADPGALPDDYQSSNVWISTADKDKLANIEAENQPKTSIPPAPKTIKQPTYEQEYQRISANIKQSIIEECKADPFIVYVPGFGESELEFIEQFSKYMTEKNGYINPDQTEPIPVISDYQREYDRRTFEYVAKYPSVIVRREGLTDLHFDIEEAMELEGYDRQKSTSENELSPANGHPITIDPDYQKDDREDFIDQLNKSVVHKSKSSRPTQRRQDDGMSM